jgi:hypothetical protein
MSASILLATIMSSQIVAVGLTCPPKPPAEWGLSKSKLETVSVVSYPSDEAIADDDTRWAMVPTKQWQAKGKLHQSWELNFDAPKYVFKVDCGYLGTARFLRLDAANVRRCTAVWDFRNGKVVPGSVQFQCDAGS